LYHLRLRTDIKLRAIDRDNERRRGWRNGGRRLENDGEARGSICSRRSRFELRAILLRPLRIVSPSWNNRRVLRNACGLQQSWEERSRSVGCAITFHRASVIAGPAFARGKKKEEERKEGGGKYSFYVYPSFVRVLY